MAGDSRFYYFQEDEIKTTLILYLHILKRKLLWTRIHLGSKFLYVRFNSEIVHYVFSHMSLLLSSWVLIHPSLLSLNFCLCCIMHFEHFQAFPFDSISSFICIFVYSYDLASYDLFPMISLVHKVKIKKKNNGMDKRSYLFPRHLLCIQNYQYLSLIQYYFHDHNFTVSSYSNSSKFQKFVPIAQTQKRTDLDIS